MLRCEVFGQPGRLYGYMENDSTVLAIVETSGNETIKVCPEDVRVTERYAHRKRMCPGMETPPRVMCFSCPGYVL
jgi:hypothetical protein